MRTITILCVLCVSCTTTTTDLRSAVTEAAAPAPAPPLKGGGFESEVAKCGAGSGQAWIERLSPATVNLVPGTDAELTWRISTMCSPIVLTGYKMRFRQPDGRTTESTALKPDRIVTTENPMIFSIPFRAEKTMAGRSLEIDMSPLWKTKAFGRHVFTGADRIGSTETLITVLPVPSVKTSSYPTDSEAISKDGLTEGRFTGRLFSRSNTTKHLTAP